MASIDRLRALLIRDHPGAYAELRVGPLSAGECLRLVRHLREEDRHASDIDKLILDKTGGNPFFVEEVVHSLADVGLVAPATGDNRLPAKGEGHQPITIPDSIQDVIAARIDHLDGDVKRILKLASVVGRSFLYKVLDAVDEASSDLDKNLGELEHLQLVQERRRLPELEYMFKHALVQEVTYESILLQRRRQLHRNVAECVEHLFADRLEEFCGVLAHHYARAEEWEKAHPYLVRAGDQAGRMAADAEALASYEHALVAYEHAFGDRWEPLQRASLARKMGESLFRRGEFEHAIGHLQNALIVLGGPTFPTSRGGVRSAILVCEFAGT